MSSVATFNYQARDETGRMVKGSLEAETRVVLADRLRKMGYLVTQMEEVQAGAPALPELSWGRAISEEQLLLTCIQLANLVEAGLPLVSALNTLSSQSSSAALQKALEEVARDIEGGASFSKALERQPRIFPELMVNMVGVGESSGKLDTVLMRFSALMEKDVALKKTVQSALTYPAFLLMVSLGLTLFMVTFVIPQFAVLFTKAGIQLPAPTLLLASVGGAFRRHGLFLLMAAATALFASAMMVRIPSVRRWLDRVLWNAPGIGPLLQLSLISRFSRNLATLVASGVPILSALDAAKKVVTNEVIVQEVARVRFAVERGERMAATLSVGKVFRADVVQMIHVGEETGRLDGMLGKVADYYDLRVEFAVKQMTALLEPVLLVGLGAIVACMIASLLLPMFDMVKVLQKGGIR